MSVISVKLDGRSFDYDVGLTDQGNVEGKYVLVYSVLFDNNDRPKDRPLLAVDAEGIPAFYTNDLANEWFYVKRKRPVQKGTFLYEVVVTYVSFDDPLSFLTNPPIIQWLKEDSQEPIDIDIDGNAIANAAGQPFDPPIQKIFGDTVLSITVVRPGYNAALASVYHRAVNSDTFWGPELGPPGSVMAIQIQGIPFRGENGRWYFTHNYQFAFRNDPILTNGIPANWKRRIKNEGLMCTVSVANNAIIHCTDSAGENVNEPVPLATDGTQLADGLEPNWLLFDLQPKLPFTAFGLQDVFTYWTGLNP